MADYTVRVEADLRPAYYDDFHCIAQDCRLNCCKGGWTISFDKNDYFRLKKLARNLSIGKELEKSLTRLQKDNPYGHYGQFRLEKTGVCPHQTEAGLCGLQLEAGEKALPLVCRQFPRVEAVNFSGYLERSLTPACEAVLYQLWDLPEGVAFRSDPLPKEERKRLKRDGAPPPLFPYFQDLRSVCIDLLQDRRLPLAQRILLMGLRLRELAETPENELDVPAWIQRTGALLADPAAPELCRPLLPEGDRAKAAFLNSNLHTLIAVGKGAYAAFSPVKNALLNAMELIHKEGTTFTLSLEPYARAEAAFRAAFGGRDYFFENLAVTVFFHLRLPLVGSGEKLWQSYVNYCHLLSFFRFVSVLSAMATLPAAPGEEEAPAPGSREALVRVLVLASRDLLHNSARAGSLRDEFFKNDSATLAHMAILLG